MAERVQVIVEAKDAASGVLRGITQQMGALGSATQELTGRSINWGNVAQQAYRIISDALKESVRATTEYSAAVRDLALASGGTAEEASRLIQVLDDFEISATDINTAVKALTKQGLAPTVETIAQLSDEYNKLNTAEEKNAFLIENLGRGSLKWANALKEGKEELLLLNEGVNESLILTDDNIRASEDYRLALDNWNDAVLGLKVSIGNELLPVLTDLINSDFEKAMINGQKATGVAGVAVKILSQDLNLVAEEATMAAQYYSVWTKALEKGNSSVDATISDYGKLLSLSQGLNNASREQIKMEGYKQLQEKFKESGGEIDAGEAKILEDAGVALGVFDRFAVNAANSVDNLSSALASGQIELSEYIALLNQIPTAITTNVTTNTGSVPMTVYSGITTGGVLTCFIAGTLVSMADGTQKAIEEIQIGEMVWSRDFDKNENTKCVVSGVHHHNPQSDFYLEINGIGATVNHPFYVQGKGWTWAGNLHLGDTLLTMNGVVMVVSIERVDRKVNTYNLHIDNKHHNYFAGGVLVHNKAEGGWIGGSGSGNVDTGYVPAAPGEYMVNARDARKNAGLLEAINSGQDVMSGASNYFYGNNTFVIGGDGSAFMEQR